MLWSLISMVLDVTIDLHTDDNTGTVEQVLQAVRLKTDCSVQ